VVVGYFTFVELFGILDGVSVYMISGGQPNQPKFWGHGLPGRLVLPLRTPPKYLPYPMAAGALSKSVRDRRAIAMIMMIL